MRHPMLVLLFSCSFLTALSQHSKKEKYLVLAITNAHTAKPFGSFTGLFTKEFHPGFESGLGINWKSKKKHDWFQELRFGYFYHRWVQHSFALYTELGYRHRLPLNVEVEGRLGGGYARVIVANQVFSDGYDKNRQYTKITSGRNQAIITTSFAISKTVIKDGNTKAFFQYQQRLQTPFVQSYIPLLPYNMAMLGIRHSIHSKTKNH